MNGEISKEIYWLPSMRSRVREREREQIKPQSRLTMQSCNIREGKMCIFKL